MTPKLNKKIFGTLFFSILATITGVGIVVPLLPVYARQSGASGLYIGLIFGAFSLSRTFLLPVFGRWSDRKGRKPFILAGLISYALVSVAFIMFPGVNHMIIIRFFQGIASAMIMPVIQAYVGDMTPEGREGFVMGIFNMSLFFGLSAGPVAGGVISDHFSLQAAFICMGLLALVGFGLCWMLLPPTHSEVALRKGQPPIQWRAIMGDRVIIGLFAFRAAHTACIGIIWSFLPVLANKDFGLNGSQIGILVMLGVLVSGVIQAPLGYLADCTNRKVMILVGGVFVAVAVLAYAWASDYLSLIFISVAFGLSGGAAMPAMMAVAVLKGSQMESMGSVMSVLTVAHSLGMFAGAVMAGLMMDWFELRVAFILGAGIMMMGTIAFWGMVYGQPIGPNHKSATSSPGA